MSKKIVIRPKGKGLMQRGKTHSSNAGTEKMSLAGFRDVEWPDCDCVKLVYNDFRAVVAAGNQATYLYRLNSVFDPDETGVGGQPAGFDQLKTLYGRYRVVAVRARVSCACMTSGGSAFLAIAPVDNSGITAIAEDIASLRHAGSAQASNNAKLAVVDKLWHISELLGYSDESVLANTNLDAAVTGNPGFQQHLFIAAETTGVTDQVELEVQLTYYTRMEVAIAVEDSLARSKAWAMKAKMGLPSTKCPVPAVPRAQVLTNLAKSMVGSVNHDGKPIDIVALLQLVDPENRLTPGLVQQAKEETNEQLLARIAGLLAQSRAAAK